MIPSKPFLIPLLPILLVLILASCGDKEKKTETGLLAPQQFKTAIDVQKNEIILDVRTPKEYGEAKIHQAQNIDFYQTDFKEIIKQLDRNKTYFVYCRSGKRSANTSTLMREAGFERVYDLKGGILAWKEAKLPVE